VPKTLLAVDDSATMRKVLEITFAGEDFRVLAVDGTAKALALLGEGPVAAVIDTSLEGDDGYALAKELRSRDPRIAILLMASRYNPYDANRGRDAGADDYVDKPFDTQAVIDKLKKAIGSREAGKGAIAAAPPPAPAPAPPAPAAAPPARHSPVPFAAPVRPPVVTPATGARPPVISSTQRTHTLSFEGNQASPPAPPAVISSPFARTAPSGMPVAQAPHPVAPAPAPAPVSHAVAPAAPPPPAPPPPAPPPARIEAGPVAAAVNGQLSGKLGELGLTPQQAEAVLALSREVVERVVWEVVPQLAEVIIKEEIARLTRDG
jgi:CheY-like chemotaxis protein